MSDEACSDLSQFECPICYKQYGIRSSYVRHSRKCLEQTVSSSKQKSCRRCASSKVRCDKTRPVCSRCALRGENCGYTPNGSQRREKQNGAFKTLNRRSLDAPNSENDEPASQASCVPVEGGEHSRVGSLSSNSLIYHPVPDLETDATLGADLTTPSTSSPVHSSATPSNQCLIFTSRIFRTYPRMMSGREHLPPFIHQSQISSGSISVPLVNCFALCRMWESGSNGDSGKELVESSIRREMEKIFHEYLNYDDTTLVAAFQSALIYAVILLFPGPQQPPSKLLDIQTLISLQELSLHVFQSKYLLPEEMSHTRPSWKEWVLISCKRRTFMSYNLFRWINAIYNGFSRFPCADVDFMPAPTGKVLWNITTHDEWEVAYDRWLGRWAGMGIYTLGDIQKVYSGPELDLRSEMWLEEADEFGIMCIALIHHS